MLVFGRDGSFLRRIGGRGEGPGEIRRVEEVEILSGDSLVVLEFGRISVFDSTGAFVRSLEQRGHKDDAFVSGRDLVFSGSLSTPGGAGLAFHVVPLDGGSAPRSFGSGETLPPGEMGAGFSIAPADGGGLWAGSRYQYVIDRWNGPGEHATRFVRAATWFPRWSQPFTVTPSSPRPPLLMDLHARGNILYVLVSVAHRDWERRLPPPEVHRGVRYWSGIFQTRIEALDMVNGRVMAVRTVDDTLYGFLRGGLAYASRETPSGTVLVDIWRVRLARTGSP